MKRPRPICSSSAGTWSVPLVKTKVGVPAAEISSTRSTVRWIGVPRSARHRSMTRATASSGWPSSSRRARRALAHWAYVARPTTMAEASGSRKAMSTSPIGSSPSSASLTLRCPASSKPRITPSRSSTATPARRRKAASRHGRCGTGLATTTSPRAIDTSPARVRTTSDSARRSTSSPRASVARSPPSMRWRTTTREPRGRASRAAEGATPDIEISLTASTDISGRLAPLLEKHRPPQMT